MIPRGTALLGRRTNRQHAYNPTGICLNVLYESTRGKRELQASVGVQLHKLMPLSDAACCRVCRLRNAARQSAALVLMLVNVHV